MKNTTFFEYREVAEKLRKLIIPKSLNLPEIQYPTFDMLSPWAELDRPFQMREIYPSADVDDLLCYPLKGFEKRDIYLFEGEEGDGNFLIMSHQRGQIFPSFRLLDYKWTFQCLGVTSSNSLKNEPVVKDAEMEKFKALYIQLCVIFNPFFDYEPYMSAHEFMELLQARYDVEEKYPDYYEQFNSLLP